VSLSAAASGIIIAWVASEILLSIVRRSRGASDRSLDRSSMRVLWLTIVLAVTAGVLLAGSRRGAFGGHAATWEIAGIVLILAGLALRWWAILTLREAFTVDVAVAGGQRVVEHGPYRWVRHPSYSGMLISFLGLGVHLRHWTSLMALMVPITAALLYRIRVEEHALREGLGEAYADFMHRRRRLVPGIY
jgi:protein-S-isoprenylcysteine O-methyltransferase Ste14